MTLPLAGKMEVFVVHFSLRLVSHVCRTLKLPTGVLLADDVQCHQLDETTNHRGTRL